MPAGQFSITDLDVPSAPPPSPTGTKGRYMIADLEGSSSPESHPLDRAARAIKEWWDSGPIGALKGTAAAIRDPKAAVGGALDQNGELWRRAKDAYDKGDYTGAAAHALNYALNGIPGLGFSLDDAGEKFQKGDIAGGMGQSLGFATNMVLGAKMPQIADAALNAKIPDVSQAAGVLKDVFHVTHSANPITRARAAASLFNSVRDALTDAPDTTSATTAPKPLRAVKPTAKATASEPLIIPAESFRPRGDVIGSDFGVLPAIDRSQFFREFAPQYETPATAAPAIAPKPAVPEAAPAVSAPAVEEPVSVTPDDELEQALQKSIDLVRARRGAPAAEPSPQVQALNSRLIEESAASAKQMAERARTAKALKLGRFLQETGLTPDQVDIMEPDHWEQAARGAGVPKPSTETIQQVRELMHMGQ